MKKTSKELDQFYTSPVVAKHCFDNAGKHIKLSQFFLIEPSAGSGNFSNLFHKNHLALDIDPKIDNIQQADFLAFSSKDLEKHTTSIGTKKIAVIGNPPFGKNSSLALKFFNKSAEFAEYICFILPKTFKKTSMINRLDLNFHLISEIQIPKDSFLLDGAPYDVPCVFQIWGKSESPREKIKTHNKTLCFEFSTKDNADFAIRRVGGLSGKVLISFESYKEPSHYYIKSVPAHISKPDLITKMQSLYGEFNAIAQNSAGNPSLSKHELIDIFQSKFGGCNG